MAKFPSPITSPTEYLLSTLLDMLGLESCLLDPFIDFGNFGIPLPGNDSNRSVSDLDLFLAFYN